LAIVQFTRLAEEKRLKATAADDSDRLESTRLTAPTRLILTRVLTTRLSNLLSRSTLPAMILVAG
jgi:hypothetical protein